MAAHFSPVESQYELQHWGRSRTRARNRDIPRRRRTGVTFEHAVLHGTCTLLAGLQSLTRLSKQFGG